MIARLDGFEAAIASAAALTTGAGSIDVVNCTGSDNIELRQLLVRLPNATPLVSADGFSIHSHERTLVTGPSGAGKSTLFRAIAGVWPFGTGTIAIPAKATLMMLPQRPYFPVGLLQAAIVYPAEANAYTAEQVANALIAVGLPRLAPRLEEEAHWNSMLRSANSSVLGWHARFCTRRNICSWTKRPRRSMRPPKRRSIVSWRRSCRQRRWSRSATGARCRPSTSAMLCWPVLAIGSSCRTKTRAASRHNGLQAHPAAAAAPPCGPAGRSTSPVKKHPVRQKTRGRQIALPPFQQSRHDSYFRLVIAVRSAESLTIPAAPHQLEPAPPGLIDVTLVVPEALKALVKALQLPFDRSELE